MDFPQDPGIGLVDGRFVDENAATGSPGSTIPASWGNGLTDEMLNVIRAAGLTPDENDVAQLLEALRLVTRSLQATETLAGVARLATQALTNARADDLTIVTPKKLGDGFALSISGSSGGFGYFRLPWWLGGFIFQWGTTNVQAIPAGYSTSLVLPLAYTTYAMGVLVGYGGNTPPTATNALAGYHPGLDSVVITAIAATTTTPGVFWVSIGI